MKHNQTVPLLDAAADSVPLTDEEKADCGLLSELFPEDDSGVAPIGEPQQEKP